MSELYLIARIAGRLVAVEASQIASAVDIDTVVPVPLAAPSVRGLAALRSRVVTVIDPREPLGVDGETPVRRAIVGSVETTDYAFLVDSLDDVAAFEAQPLAPGVVLAGGWRSAGRGVVERDGEPILILDLRALVPGSLPAAAAA